MHILYMIYMAIHLKPLIVELLMVHQLMLVVKTTEFACSSCGWSFTWLFTFDFSFAMLRTTSVWLA